MYVALIMMIGSKNMGNDKEEDQSYLGFLRKGSDRHKVRVIGQRIIEISPVSKNSKDLMAFRQIVLDAIAYSYEGYHVFEHEDNMTALDGTIYDIAIISWENKPDLD
jgi:hypothetical protein